MKNIKTIHSNKAQQYLLLVLFIFCQLFISISNAHNVTQRFLPSKNNSDLAAICSGNGEIRWISLSQYYQTGKLVFVDEESTSQQPVSNASNCLTCSLFNQFDNDELALFFAAFDFQPVKNFAQIEQPCLNTKNAYIDIKARAPPYSL